MKQNEIIKIADVLKIPSAYLVRSWDNLTNKSTMNLFPDYVLLWNDFQINELKEIQQNKISQPFKIGAHLYEYLLSDTGKKMDKNYFDDILENKKIRQLLHIWVRHLK